MTNAELKENTKVAGKLKAIRNDMISEALNITSQGKLKRLIRGKNE